MRRLHAPRRCSSGPLGRQIKPAEGRRAKSAKVCAVRSAAPTRFRLEQAGQDAARRGRLSPSNCFKSIILWRRRRQPTAGAGSPQVSQQATACMQSTMRTKNVNKVEILEFLLVHPPRQGWATACCLAKTNCQQKGGDCAEPHERLARRRDGAGLRFKDGPWRTCGSGGAVGQDRWPVLGHWSLRAKQAPAGWFPTSNACHAGPQG